MKKLLIISLIVIFTCLKGMAQELILYKEIDTCKLYLEVLNPEPRQDESRPAVVFFFGGGWKGGKTDQFRPHAEHFSNLGIVCFLADYRVEERNGTSPFHALADAKSAIRFIRANAIDFGIDPERIIASGGSAGGHLAAATALIESYNDPADPDISCIPNALILFNPVIDNGPGGYGFERVGNEYKKFSPLYNIKHGAPPTIFFLGTNDNLIPVVTAEYYKILMENAGSRCDLHLYDGAGHGFFNFQNTENYYDTVSKADEFLRSLGYIE